jgi:hypothetical protein
LYIFQVIWASLSGGSRSAIHPMSEYHIISYHIKYISEPPSFNDDDSSGDVTVKEGQPAKFICSASGYPRPSIQWKREDDRPISGAKAGK